MSALLSRLSALGRRRPRKKLPQQRRIVPRLEALEERSLLSVSTFTSNTAVAIFDRAVVTSTLNVPAAGVIQDIDVLLNITHTYDSDLLISLISPDGTRVALINRAGGENDNFTSTRLSDEAETFISSGSAPFTGTFRPSGTLGSLDSKNMQGDWQLEIEDFVDDDTGTLLNWSLIIDSTSPPAENTAPVNSVPASLTIAGTTSTLISGLSVADDFSTGSLTVTLQVDNGTISVATGVPGGVSGENISNNQSASVTLRGTAAQVNSTLATVRYDADFGFRGADALMMRTRDFGGLVDQDIVPMEVLANISIPAGFETLVNTHTSGQQVLFIENKLSVGTDAVGNSVVVWTSVGQDNGSTRGVYAQRFDAGGNRVGTEFRVNTVTSNDQSTPSVAVRPNGSFVVVWRSVGQEIGGSSGSNGVFARLFDSTGNALGSEFQVNTTIALSQTAPSVAMDSQGNFVVAWQSDGQDGSGFGIFARRYNALGIAQGSEVPVNTTTAGAQTNPIVSCDAAGNFVVVWQGPDDSGLGIFARRFTAAGSPRDAAEFRVNATTASDQQLPSVAMDRDGDFVVVWQSLNQDGSGTGVFARRFNASGVAQETAEFRVNTTTAGTQSAAAVATDPDGNFLISWSSFNQNGDSTRDIYAQHFTAAGERLGWEFRVNQTLEGHQENASVAVAGDGEHVWVVWSREGPNDDEGVSFQRFIINDEPGVVASLPDIDLPAGSAGASTALRNFFTDAQDGPAGLTFSVEAINAPAGVFVSAVIDPATGELRVAATAGTTAAVDITIRATDRGGLFVSDTFRVNIGVADAPAVNDSPVNLLFPSIRSVNENLSIVLDGIAVADVDNPTSDLTVTLTVRHGHLTVADDVPGGAGIEGNNSNAVTLVGTLAELNATLSANAVYQPDPDFAGLDDLVLRTSDGVSVDTDIVRLQVHGVQAFHSIDVPKAIPFGDIAFSFSELVIAESYLIADLDVLLDISHPIAADVLATLIAPDGTRVALIDTNDTRANFTNTIFDDEASESITHADAPFTGRFRPDEALSIFDGRNVQGTWTLQIANLADAPGQLVGWSLIVDPATSYASNVAPRSIPDPGQTTSTIAIADDFLIRDVNVNLSVDHSYVGDLDVVLVAPDGTEVELFSDVGEIEPVVAGVKNRLDNTSNFADTIFDDEAELSIRAGSAPFAGRFKPEGSLAAFIGKSAKGTWTLRVTDDAGNDIGQLVNWSLDFEVAAEVPELAGEVFQILQSEAQWGDTVTVQYTIRNQGLGAAGAFVVEPRLSSNGTITNQDVLLPGSFSVSGLAAGASISGTLQVTLPATPPDGFNASGPIHLGFRVDANNSVVESNEDNNRNRGAGRDLQTLQITNGMELGAVGEVDSYTLTVVQAGYVEVAVVPDGSSFDGRVSLFSKDSIVFYDDLPIAGGGLLAGSDDRTADNVNPYLRHYVLPGTYRVEVSSALRNNAGVGAYRLQVALTADPDNPYASDVGLPPLPVVNSDPVKTVAGDFNRDRIFDVATITADGRVAVLLAVGDGTFAAPVYYQLPNAAQEIITVEFNDDNRLDIAVVNHSAGVVSFLLGAGDGTFRTDAASNGIALDSAKVSGLLQPSGLPLLVTRDQPVVSELTIFEKTEIVDLDVILDISSTVGIVSDLSSLSVVLVAPDGTRVELIADTGSVNDSLSQTVLDDEAAATLADGSDPFTGRFRPSEPLSAFDGKSVQGTWKLEVTANPDSINFTGRLNHWSMIVNGTSVHTNRRRNFLEGDFNGDGHVDRVGIEASELALRLGISELQNAYADFSTAAYDFLRPLGEPLLPLGKNVPADLVVSAGIQTPNASRATPILGDLNGDRFDDVVLLKANGDIVVRFGDAVGEFTAPVVVNADRDETPRSRAVAILSSGVNAVLASVDLFSDSLSLFTRRANGSWVRTFVETGVSPSHVAAGDLDGDGDNDLVVANGLMGTLSFYLMNADGSLQSMPDIKVGIAISDVVLDDVNGDGRVDVLVSNHLSGDVSVLVNRQLAAGSLGFEGEQRFRAGAGAYGVIEGGTAALSADAFASFGVPDAFPPQYFTFSGSETASVATGDFNRDGVVDVVAVNRGNNTFGLLLGKKVDGEAVGSFVDPVFFTTGSEPTVISVGQLNDDNGDDIVDDRDFLDVVVLNQGGGTVSVSLANGEGGFTQHGQQLAAGNSPTGMSLADIDGDGALDILVGNSFGDLLILSGRGDGSFDSYQRVGKQIAIAVMDVDGDGKDDSIVYANEALDRVAIGAVGSTNVELQGREEGMLAPGAVQLVDMNNDGEKDLIVANSGGTSLFVFRGLGNGQFGARQEFFVGANPAGVTIADVNNDGILDAVVANRGANDVSLLLGSGQGDAWTMTQGVRLDTGAGPVATAVRDVNGDGNVDILVSNQQAGTVTQLNGQGNGFFNDQNAPTFDVGSLPSELFVGNFDGRAGLDLVTINAGSNTITMWANYLSAPEVFTSFSGGIRPVAALSGDFDGNGIGDLVVANNGNGVISLLLGGQEGFTLASQLRTDGNPTALAFADSAGEFYVGLEGEQAVRLGFNLGFDGPLGDPVGGTSRVEFASLRPLAGGGLAVVVSLQTGGDDFATSEFFGLFVLFITSGGEETETLTADTISAEAWSRLYDNDRQVVDFVIGLEELEERLRLEAEQRLNGELPGSSNVLLVQPLSYLVENAPDLVEATWRILRHSGGAVAIELEEVVRRLVETLFSKEREALPAGDGDTSGVDQIIANDGNAAASVIHDEGVTPSLKATLAVAGLWAGSPHLGRKKKTSETGDFRGFVPGLELTS